MTEAKKLDGRIRGEKKDRAALPFIYAFGWSTPRVLAELAGTPNNRNHMARLHRNGLVKPIPTASQPGVSYGVVYELSRLGVDQVGEYLMRDLETAKVWVRPSQVSHDLDVQLIAARLCGKRFESLEARLIDTDRISRLQNRKEKIADAVLATRNGKCLIEVENGRKKDWEVTAFFSRPLAPNDRVIVASRHRTVLENLKSRGKWLKPFLRNAKGEMVPDRDAPLIENIHFNKYYFLELDHFSCDWPKAIDEKIVLSLAKIGDRVVVGGQSVIVL